MVVPTLTVLASRVSELQIPELNVTAMGSALWALGATPATPTATQSPTDVQSTASTTDHGTRTQQRQRERLPRTPHAVGLDRTGRSFPHTRGHVRDGRINRSHGDTIECVGARE